MKTAILIGATGATGKPLLQLLLNSANYAQVKVFVRRPTGITHAKLDEHIIDFDQLDQHQQEIQGDDLFSALGTTLAIAGSQQAQYKVDYTYQANFIALAAANKVQRLFLVSSPNANASSPFFYARMKAELDIFAAQQAFDVRVFFKPSIIESNREDKRFGEKAAAKTLHFSNQYLGLFKKYKPITAEQLAQAIIHCAESTPPLSSGNHNLVLDAVHRWV